MIDEFNLQPRESPFDPLSVILFKALQVVAFLFFIAFLALSQQKDSGKIDTKAELFVSMTWPDNHPDDFDLFVQDPLGNVVWYRRRDIGFLTLERDNRGGANNFINVGGEKILSPSRQELVSIRGIVAGEYTVNVYHFSARTGLPVPVTVTVEKLNPHVTVIARETLDVDKERFEKTAVRFTLDAKGNVVSTSRVDRSILQSFFDHTANGATISKYGYKQ
ncbi:MAG: hypothetical protein ACK4TP_01515 [Hyphomicrobium sp.]|jgi:hypothetical protein